MTDKERQERARFLTERRTAIGGSDVHEMLSQPPWGCAHRLWLDKRGVEPDRPEEEDDETPLERGRICEGLVVNQYVRKTGRRVVRRGIRRHPDFPFMAVHIDREIQLDPRGKGVLEVKTVGQWMYHQVAKTGLPPAYVLQIQWGIGITAATWGSFAVKWLDGWKLRYFDVERDDVLINHLFEEAISFWRQVENGPAPAKLIPDDDRCGGCEYAARCHGDAIAEMIAKHAQDKTNDYVVDERIAPLVRAYQDARMLEAEAKGLLLAERAPLEAALGARAYVATSGFKVQWPYQDGKVTASPKLLRAVLEQDGARIPEDVRSKLEKVITTGDAFRVLRVYPTRKT